MLGESGQTATMLPSDYLRKGFCNGLFSAEDASGRWCYPDAHAARYSIDGAVSTYLESVYDADSEEFSVANMLWLVGIHREVESVFPEWLSSWHREVRPEECCFHPLDMVLSFGNDHGQADCVRILQGVERQSTMSAIRQNTPNDYTIDAGASSGTRASLLPSVG